MAFRLLVICALVLATANANFFFHHTTFPTFQMPPMPTMPPMPPMPPMPTMPPMPKFVFPPMPKMPSLKEMEERSKTDPNTNFNSVSVSSSSSSYVDENGKVIKKGGTSVFSNNNGDINTVKFGNDPPPLNVDSSTKNQKDESKTETPKDKSKIIDDDIKITKEKNPKKKTPKVKKLKKYGPKIQNVVSSFTSSNIDDDGNFQSASSNSVGGSSFSSFSSSSSSSSSNINGVKSGGGISSTLYNVNGNSGGETVMYSSS